MRRNPAHYATSGQAFEWGEFLFMENHFRVLEMAYHRWKKKHGSMGNNNRVRRAVPLIIA